MCRQNIFTCLIACIFLSGCFGASLGEPVIDRIARIQKSKWQDYKYVIWLSGSQTVIGHAHVPGILPGKQPLSGTIYLNSLEGTVDASRLSLLIHGGQIRGTVTFLNKTRLQVELEISTQSENGPMIYQPYLFNGEYELRAYE